MATFHDSLKQLVERAAVATVNKWPSYISTEDVQQEIWAWALSKQRSIETAQKLEGWEGQVYSTMLKVASSAASTEDQQANGYTKEDTYIYSAAVIETLLDSVFQYEDWQSFGYHGDGQPRAKAQVNQSGDMIAMLSDVKAALAVIKMEYRETLFLRYGMQLQWSAVGDILNRSQDSARHHGNAAINALREALGRVNPADLRGGWDGRRESFTGESAQIRTDRQYEG